ncbi:MAG: NAD(P)-dependent alcohol dehydrogenase, partial [Luminiphilus sp.]
PYVLETSGLPSVLSQAILSSSIGGEIGIVGAPPMGTTVPVDVNFLLFNRKLRGIIEGQAVSDIFIPRLIDLYSQGKFPFDKLIKFYSFDEIDRAAEDSEKGITLKPVIRIA